MANKTVVGTIQQRRGSGTEWESKNPVLAEGEIGYGDGVTKIGDGKTAWNALPAFATTRFTFGSAGWGDIARICAEGKHKEYFHVGDEKTIILTTGEEVTLVILGFDHDDLTDGGKAPITIGMKNCLATRYTMNSSLTNSGGWDESIMRTQTMATLLSQLTADLQGVIKSVDKKTTAGGASKTITTSSDKLFLFSVIEIEGGSYTPASNEGYNGEGEQYEYWRTIKDGAGTGSSANTDRIKYLSNGGGAAVIWWLRSPSLGGTTAFMGVDETGNIAAVIKIANFPYGVSFGFCI